MLGQLARGDQIQNGIVCKQGDRIIFGPPTTAGRKQDSTTHVSPEVVYTPAKRDYMKGLVTRIRFGKATLPKVVQGESQPRSPAGVVSG